jgi:hypothetical protein
MMVVAALAVTLVGTTAGPARAEAQSVGHPVPVAYHLTTNTPSDPLDLGPDNM